MSSSSSSETGEVENTVDDVVGELIERVEERLEDDLIINEVVQDFYPVMRSAMSVSDVLALATIAKLCKRYRLDQQDDEFIFHYVMEQGFTKLRIFGFTDQEKLLHLSQLLADPDIVEMGPIYMELEFAKTSALTFLRFFLGLYEGFPVFDQVKLTGLPIAVLESMQPLTEFLGFWRIKWLMIAFDHGILHPNLVGQFYTQVILPGHIQRITSDQNVPEAIIQQMAALTNQPNGKIYAFDDIRLRLANHMTVETMNLFNFQKLWSFGIVNQGINWDITYAMLKRIRAAGDLSALRHLRLDGYLRFNVIPDNTAAEEMYQLIQTAFSKLVSIYIHRLRVTYDTFERFLVIFSRCTRLTSLRINHIATFGAPGLVVDVDVQQDPRWVNALRVLVPHPTLRRLTLPTGFNTTEYGQISTRQQHHRDRLVTTLLTAVTGLHRLVRPGSSLQLLTIDHIRIALETLGYIDPSPEKKERIRHLFRMQNVYRELDMILEIPKLIRRVDAEELLYQYLTERNQMIRDYHGEKEGLMTSTSKETLDSLDVVRKVYQARLQKLHADYRARRETAERLWVQDGWEMTTKPVDRFYRDQQVSHPRFDRVLYLQAAKDQLNRRLWVLVHLNQKEREQLEDI